MKKANAVRGVGTNQRLFAQGKPIDGTTKIYAYMPRVGRSVVPPQPTHVWAIVE